MLLIKLYNNVGVFRLTSSVKYSHVFIIIITYNN